MCFRGDHSWLAVMEGLKDLQADLLAWLQLELPSHGQNPQGLQAESGAGGWEGTAKPRAAESLGWSTASQPSLPPSSLCLRAPEHCGLRGQNIFLGGGNC